MSAFEATVMAELTLIRRRLDDLTAEQQPDLTKADFARKAGISVTTVDRRVASGDIVLRKGRVPYKYLRAVSS